MNISIWIIGDDRRQMMANQRMVNGTGSLQATCLLSMEAVEKAVGAVSAQDFSEEDSLISPPSLIIADDAMLRAGEDKILKIIQDSQILMGVPLFLAVDKKDEQVEEVCFTRGAVAVVHKPLTKGDVMRAENAARQHDNSRKYERRLQKQAEKLKTAKEILRLNTELRARNNLLHKVFGRYFSDNVVDLILEDPQGASIGGEKRPATIMMSDIRGFTSISESLDAHAVTTLLNFYFSHMIDAITKYKGTIIEVLGDGLLAVFGAPLSCDDQVENAIAAGITMQNAMPKVHEFCKENGFPRIEMGIGINYGEVFIGNIGSEKMMRYNVLGSTVNQTSRIESCSIGGQVLVSRKIRDMSKAPLTVRKELTATMKGVKQPLSIFVISAIGGDFDCKLDNDDSKPEVFYSVKPGVELKLFPIESKQVRDEPIIAIPDHISFKRVVVRCKESDIKDIQLYSEVLISDDKEIYVKAVMKEGELLNLRFTYQSDAAMDFLEKYRYEELGTEVK